MKSKDGILLEKGSRRGKKGKLVSFTHVDYDAIGEKEAVFLFIFKNGKKGDEDENGDQKGRVGRCAPSPPKELSCAFLRVK
jgi:hypothetical protein